MTSKRGAALVEFALMALYILVFGGIELGRMIFISQVLQDAARIAARELSVTPLTADCASFENALANLCNGADPQVDVQKTSGILTFW
jgi:Flp pilus assembly protein TadG